METSLRTRVWRIGQILRVKYAYRFTLRRQWNTKISVGKGLECVGTSQRRLKILYLMHLAASKRPAIIRAKHLLSTKNVAPTGRHFHDVTRRTGDKERP